jgi:hypothetical protein
VVTGLHYTLDYGWLDIIADPLSWGIHKINDFVGSWGWSIILRSYLINLQDTNFEHNGKMNSCRVSEKICCRITALLFMTILKIMVAKKSLNVFNKSKTISRFILNSCITFTLY